MKLHGYYRSSASFRVRIALNLKGIEYKDVLHHLRKDEQGRMTSGKRAVEPYVVPLADDQRSAYQNLRVRESAALTAAI